MLALYVRQPCLLHVFFFIYFFRICFATEYVRCYCSSRSSLTAFSRHVLHAALEPPDTGFLGDMQVFMISYMFDGQGYLITSREVVSEDVEVGGLVAGGG